MHGLVSGLRSQPVRLGYSGRRLQAAERLRSQAAARQGAGLDLPAGFDLQDDGGAGGAGERLRPQDGARLRQGLAVGRARVALRRSPRRARPAQGHRHLVRHLFLPVRPGRRSGQDRRHGAQVRPGRYLRHRPAAEEGPGARHGVEAQLVRRQQVIPPQGSRLASGGNALDGHRPGLYQPQRPATVRPGVAYRQRPEGDHAAPGQVGRRDAP